MFSLFSVQIGVARTHRQSIGFAHDRTNHNLHRQIQIAHHAPDDCDLRRVFLPEERRVRFDGMKQLCHNGCDSAKVSRPRAAVQLLTQAFHRYPGHCAPRIHFFH
jgi:hypothetical protein